eukprot:COSAG02_NODE_1221_length_13805_cov_24.976653_5_plen_95_part_00
MVGIYPYPPESRPFYEYEAPMAALAQRTRDGQGAADRPVPASARNSYPLPPVQCVYTSLKRVHMYRNLYRVHTSYRPGAGLVEAPDRHGQVTVT